MISGPGYPDHKSMELDKDPRAGLQYIMYGQEKRNQKL